MRRAVRRSLTGPWAWWESLHTPPAGFRWVWLTTLDHNVFSLVGGGYVCFPSLFLEAVPQVQVPDYRRYRMEIDAMIDDSSARQEPGKWVPPADPFWAPYPTIAQYCTDFWWEAKKGEKARPRTPCKLGIQAFTDAVNVTMNDEEKRRSTHTTAQTISEALGLLEERLKAGAAPWRSWGKQRG